MFITTNLSAFIVSVFCPGYLELWLDSTLYLVLFIKFILNSVSIAYIYVLSERWLIHAEWLLFPTSVGFACLNTL